MKRKTLVGTIGAIVLASNMALAEGTPVRPVSIIICESEKRPIEFWGEIVYNFN